jgi:predicted  nucleic acid-binding Zn-ribbon protein
VGILKEGMCSACRVGLPVGKVEELVKGPDVGVCPNCNRLLIVRGL